MVSSLGMYHLHITNTVVCVNERLEIYGAIVVRFHILKTKCNDRIPKINVRECWPSPIFTQFLPFSPKKGCNGRSRGIRWCVGRGQVMCRGKWRTTSEHEQRGRLLCIGELRQGLPSLFRALPMCTYVVPSPLPSKTSLTHEKVGKNGRPFVKSS